MTADTDYVIIGGGIAGCCLAWALDARGARVTIVDSPDATAASRVAVGLMTPVIGQRVQPSWRWDDLWPVARDFYRRLEARLSLPGRLLHVNGMARLYADAEQRVRAETHLAQNGDWEPIKPPLEPSQFNNHHGGFAIEQAARLEVSRLLQVTQDFFRRSNRYITTDVDVSRDICMTDDCIDVGGITTESLIFCQGFRARENPWFPQLSFDAARGEVLTLHLPGVTEGRTLHRDAWLAPIGNERYQAGSTYDHEDLNSGPTKAGRESILHRLHDVLKIPVIVEDHRSAVRPILVGRRPVFGFHKTHRQLAFFNGLASRGCVAAPAFAATLGDELEKRRRRISDE